MGDLINKSVSFKTFPKYKRASPDEITIYRFIPFDYVIKMLLHKELIVSQTQRWEDSYENFLAKAKHVIGKTAVSYSDFIPGFYGQCWTLLKESDALWRIYSHDKRAVRIKTTIGKLAAASINEKELHLYTRRRLIGPVTYLSNSGISNWVSKNSKPFINDQVLLESLFIKRREFIHEKEVRLIIHENIDEVEEAKHIERPFIKLSIAPDDFIEEIMFDPRLTDVDFRANESVLRSIGYKNVIKKSSLYDFKPLQVNK